MDVQLYVYDLSRGLARQMSAAFLGTQIDAVYHTSLVFGGIEYFFGAGVQTSYPGMTHHGQPMEIVQMGTTQLDMNTISEYMDGLKEVYTAESYDLFMHNCNNFTHDLSQFLVGRGIPDHITSLPQTVLNTPFGQMLKPQLDQAMRGVTQAPVNPSAAPPALEHLRETNGQVVNLGKPGVHNVSRLEELERLLADAVSSTAVIFFTSSTCAPCKICYPAYDLLADELGSKVTLIKVDLNFAPDISSKYSVRATPTFMTFLHGDKVEEWAGADPSKLLSNVRLLVQMAYPPHPHSQLRLRTLQKPHNKPVLYAKVPPLDKLIAKLGTTASDPAIDSLQNFVRVRFSSTPAANVALPDMHLISSFLASKLKAIPLSAVFAMIDLLRLALIDPRVSGYLAEESLQQSCIRQTLEYVNNLNEKCPHNLRLVTLQAACNLFSSPLFPPKLLSNEDLAPLLISLVTSALLDEQHANVRVCAVSLAFNMCSWDHRRVLENEKRLLSTNSQVELAASLAESIGREKGGDSLKGLLLAIGLLAYGSELNGEVADVLVALNTETTIRNKNSPENKDLLEQVVQVVS